MPQVSTAASQEHTDGIDDYGTEEHKASSTDTITNDSTNAALISDDDSILQPLPMSFTSLDKAVKAYASILDNSGDNSATSSEMMVFSSLPVIEETTVSTQQQQSTTATGTSRKSHTAHGTSDSSNKSGRASNGSSISGISGISQQTLHDPAAELYKVCAIYA
jgi:hypothetical protein